MKICLHYIVKSSIIIRMARDDKITDCFESTESQETGYSLEVARTGGSISSLQVAGVEIMPTYRTADGRLRTSHPCVPYFGPPCSAEEPQHGYGRDSEWIIDPRHYYCKRTA